MRRAGPALFVALALLAAALHPGVVDNVDSRIVLRTAERLVDAGTWSLGDVGGTYLASPEYGGRGPDGSHQMKFGAGNALLDVPFVVLGRAALGPLGLDAHRAGEAAVAFASCLWFGLAGVLVLRIARRVMSERAAVGAALLHGVASYALVYGRSAYLETPLTVFVLLAYDAALASRDAPADPRPAWTLGAAVGAVLFVKHAALLLVLGTLPVLLLDADRRSAGLQTLRRAAAPAAAAVASWLALNHVRFGSPFETGYAASAKFGNPLLGGVADLLVSERGGLLFHAPAALLGVLGLPLLARRDRGLAWGIGASFVVVLPLYATFFSPFGGDAWGPRYLVPNAALLAVPAAVVVAHLLALGALARFAAAAVVAGGCALQVPPCLVSFTEFWTVVRTADVGPPYRTGPATARILHAKLGFGDPPWRDDIHRGVFPWRRPANHDLDLWPVRVANDLPLHARFAWTAWSAIVAGFVTAACVVARRAREHES